MYRRHISYLSESNVVCEVLAYNKLKSGSIVQRHNVLFRVLVAGARKFNVLEV
jgi:hypothetical protein